MTFDKDKSNQSTPSSSVGTTSHNLRFQPQDTPNQSTLSSSAGTASHNLRVKPQGLRKLVLTGPESSGKTTLAELLAEHYQTLWVPEYARFHIENLGRPYTELDLLDIAKEQIRQEDHIANQISNLLFCDTDLITIKVWQQEKFKGSFHWINQVIKTRPYDAYLLCAPDIPWEEDPLRENPDDRKRLYDIYEKELLELNKKVVRISGSVEERMKQATAFIDG